MDGRPCLLLVGWRFRRSDLETVFCLVIGKLVVPEALSLPGPHVDGLPGRTNLIHYFLPMFLMQSFMAVTFLISQRTILIIFLYTCPIDNTINRVY